MGRINADNVYCQHTVQTMAMLKLYISSCCSVTFHSGIQFYVVTTLSLRPGLGTETTWLWLGQDHVLA